MKVNFNETSTPADGAVITRPSMSTPPLEFVSANGLRFGYFSEGKGPLVLMVHGFPDTPHTWDQVRPAVAKAGFRVVTPFTRGYAPTEIPKDGDYRGDTLGQDVIALITALGEKSAIVVGHDWGAAAAYSAANLDPAKVSLLITVAIPHPASLVPTPRLAWIARHFLTFRFRGAAAKLRKDNFAHVDELVHRWSRAWDVPPGETDAVKRCFSEPGSVEAALGYYRAIGFRIPPSQRHKISVPAVAFAGETDLLAPSAFDRAARWYSSPYRVIKMPGGHFMHREYPEQFIENLLGVLPHH